VERVECAAKTGAPATHRRLGSYTLRGLGGRGASHNDVLIYLNAAFFVLR
jgi:hypothetical protein